MHRHYSDPKELASLLPQFSGGEFILKKGRGEGSLVFYGRIERVVTPADLLTKAITIKSQIVYEQWIGCNADFSDATRWKRVTIPSGELTLDYSWFYQQPRRARLKLESASTHDRCWLCSHTDPISLALFRMTLMTMFREEDAERQSFWQRIRNRFVP